MLYGTLSADIVKSTSLSAEDTFRLKEYLQSFIDELLVDNDCDWGRIVKGDEVELVRTNPNELLRIALILKCYVRFFKPEDEFDIDFKRQGIRISIGIGELRINDKQQGIIDGEAIYLSGRGLVYLSKAKNETIFFSSNDPSLDGIEVICSLLDTIISKATSRQCEVLYYKLKKYSELKIADILKIKQSAVNQHATSASWNAIAKAVNYFEKYHFNNKD